MSEAFDCNGVDVSFEAGADLSTKQYYAVKLDSNGQVVVAGAGEAAIGVLQNKPAAAGRAATVRVSGVSRWLTAATIAPGARVASDASGKAKTAVAGVVDVDGNAGTDVALQGSYVLGRCLTKTNSASGDFIPVLITHEGLVPTTAE